jgi:hypothetical protein
MRNRCFDAYHYELRQIAPGGVWSAMWSVEPSRARLVPIRHRRRGRMLPFLLSRYAEAVPSRRRHALPAGRSMTERLC